MKKQLRISSGLVMHANPVGDVWDYMRRGFDFHQRMGFDAVDLSLNLYTNLLGEKTLEMVERGLAYSQEIGLPIELCHLPFLTETGAEERAHFDARMHMGIECAKRLGVKYAAIHPDLSSTLPLTRYNRQEQHDRVMKALEPYAEHAAKAGVRLALENMRPLLLSEPYHRYCSQPDELCAVADALGLDVCWDFGHANIAGLKQSDALACVGKRLKMLHVNDNFGTEDVHLAPWLGRIDWADAMKGLSAVGFDGLLNYELIAVNVPLELRPAYTRYAVEAAQKLNAMLCGGE